MPYIIAILLFLSITEVSAAENVDIRLETHAKCSPAIGINNGHVTINCLDKELETKLRSLPDLTNYNANISQLVSLREELSRQNLALKKQSNNYSISQNAIDQINESLNSMEVQHKYLKRRHDDLRLQLASKLASISAIVQDETKTIVSRLSQSIAESVIDRHIERYSKTVIFDIDNKIQENQIEINSLAIRVDSLENDVSFLMDAFLQGKLQDREGFFGISLGGHYLTDDWQPSISLEYELLLPNVELIGSRGSLFFDLTWLDWEETTSFETLPGVIPTKVQDDRGAKLFSLGGRLFLIDWSPSIYSYVGALVGHTIDSRRDYPYFAISFGTEYFSTGKRISVELRWETMGDIESEGFDFNPLGSATTTTKVESIDGYFIGLRISYN